MSNHNRSEIVIIPMTNYYKSINNLKIITTKMTNIRKIDMSLKFLTKKHTKQSINKFQDKTG